MNVILWTVQIILTLMFLITGSMKSLTYEKAKANLLWVKDTLKGLVIFVGVSEMLGAICLIVPYSLDIIPILTPIAAFALALVMLLAAIFHIRRKEYKMIWLNIVLLALAIFDGIGRLKIKNTKNKRVDIVLCLTSSTLLFIQITFLYFTIQSSPRFSIATPT